MPQETIRIGVIGCGRIGQVHALSVTATDGAELSVVCDAVPEAATFVADLHDARVAASPQELLESDDVDAVIIGSPTATHVDLLDATIDAGKPALCEKPIDLDISRVDALRAKAMASPVPIMLGFNRRFDPNFAALKARLDAGEIGRLEQLSIISRDPAPAPKEYLAVSGGIFRDMTIHDFDMARNFVPDIVSVYASGSTVFSDDIRDLGDYDSVVVLLTGRDGQQITITNSRHAAYGYDQRVEAFGSEGLLQVGNLTDTVVRRWTADATEVAEPYQNFFLERYATAYRLELQAFIASVRDGSPVPVGFDDGRAALILADAAGVSAREGRTVSVDLQA